MRDHERRQTGRLGGASLALACLGGCATTTSTPGPVPTGPDAPQSAATELGATPASGAAAQSAAAKETRNASEPTSVSAGPAIRGSLSSRYRARTGGDARDQDLYETLVLDVGDERLDAYTAHVMGRVSWDIDGQADRDGQFVYPSLADGYDDAFHGLLYEAYVDVERPPLVADARLGRQIDYLTPVFAYFDGARISSRAATRYKLSGGLYGGVPVRLYESSTSGDQLAGAWGEARPWQDARVRLDWMHVEDEDRFAAHQDDLYGVSYWQRFGERLRFDATYTRIEDVDRDLRARASWNDPSRDLTLQASVYRLIDTQTDFANEFDPFTSSLQNYFPYYQYRLQGSKGLGETWRVDGGMDLRRLDDEGDEGAFNHDYDRGWIALALLDAWPPGTVVTVTGDVWSSDGRDVESWGLDLSRKLESGYQLAAGTSYALYRYDLFLDSERDDVRFWYLKLKKELSKAWSFECAYDYEDDSDDDFHVLTLGATWRF